MKIKVLGSGCPTCHKLYEDIMKLKEKGKINAEVEYIDDISKLIEAGVMSSPALIIDEKVAHTGKVSGETEILEIVNRFS